MSGMECAKVLQKQNIIPQKADNRFFVLSFCWLIICAFLVASLGEGIAYLQGFGVRFEEWGEFLLIALSALACLGYLVFAHVHFGVRPNWAMLAVFLLLACGNTIALCLFPSVKEGMASVRGETFQVIYSLPLPTRLRYLLSFLVTCLFFYILWGVAPKCLKDDSVLDVLLFGSVLFFLSSIVYSWIVEWPFYESCFTTGEATPLDHCLKSFTNNVNTFGCFMLYGLASVGVLHGRRHHWFNYLLMLVFTFQIFLTFSKTCLFAAFLYWACFLFYRFFATVRAHPWRSSVLLGVGLFAMISLPFFWRMLALKSPEGFFGKSWHSLINFFPGETAPTLSSRVEIWNECIEQYRNPLDWLFGFGDRNAQWYLGQVQNFNNPDYCFTHNGFILQFFTGGILRLGVYLFLLSFAVYSYVKGFVRRQRGLVPLLLGLLAFLIHGFAETTSFLEMDTKGVLGTMVLVLPVLVGSERSKPLAELNPARAQGARACWTYVAYLLLSPVGAVCASCPAIFGFAGIDVSLSWIVSFLGLLALALIPLTVNLFARESFAKAYLPILAFSLISYLGVFALSSMLPLRQKLTELVLTLSLSVAVFAIPLFMPPFCRLGCPGLYALESKIEGALGRGLEWARRRNAKREERYYLKGASSKGRDKLHY